MGVDRTTVYKWKRAGKLDGLMNSKGQVNLTRAAKELPGRVSPKHQQSINQRWHGDKERGKADISQDEVNSYLDETIGELSKLDIYELQRRNELEKLLLAQIKRKRESGELVEADLINRQGFEAAKAIKDQCSAIPDRVAPLVAAESDIFQCKQIVIKEIDYVLENIAEKLKVLDV